MSANLRRIHLPFNGQTLASFFFFSLTFSWAWAANPAPVSPVRAAVPGPASFFDRPATDPQLTADARLAREVTVAEDGIPLRELLERIGAPGLTLTCGTSADDQKLQVYLRQRPVRAVMEELAQVLPGAWRRSEKGYRLEKDTRAVEYRDRWWRLFEQERARELDAQRAAVLSAMRQKSDIPGPGEPNPENVSPEMYERMGASQLFWNLLPPSLQERVAGQMIDTAYYRSGPVFYGAHMEGAVVAPFSALSPQAQSLATSAASLLLNGHSMRTPRAVSFSNGGFVVRCHILADDGQRYDLPSSLRVFVPEPMPALSLDQSSLPAMVKGLGKAAPETWKELAAFQQVRIWPNDLPTDRPNPAIPPRRAEVLDRLADVAGMEFVADYYSVAAKPLSPAEKRQRLSRPLKTELDNCAARYDLSWKRRKDGLYLFRDNRWYRDDRLEAPAPTLRRLSALLKASQEVGGAKAVTGSARGPDVAAPTAPPGDEARRRLDLMADAVRSLTLWQIANGLTYYVPEELSRTFDPTHPVDTWRPFALTVEDILGQYYTLGLYADLPPDQRSALCEGRLLLASLGQAQQQQASFLLPELQEALIDGRAEALALGLRLESPQGGRTLIGYNVMGPRPQAPVQADLVLVRKVPGTGD